jgi:hypothetical protein
MIITIIVLIYFNLHNTNKKIKIIFFIIDHFKISYFIVDLIINFLFKIYLNYDSFKYITS